MYNFAEFREGVLVCDSLHERTNIGVANEFLDTLRDIWALPSTTGAGIATSLFLLGFQAQARNIMDDLGM